MYIHEEDIQAAVSLLRDQFQLEADQAEAIAHAACTAFLHSRRQRRDINKDATLVETKEAMLLYMQKPINPLTVMRLMEDNGYKRDMYRRAYSDLLYMHEIHYLDPDHVVATGV